jgi:hypothetical protein
LKEKSKFYDILNFEKVVNHLSKFIEIKLEIYELKVKSQFIDIISNLAVMMLIISFGMFLLFFVSLAFGLYLNSYFDSNYIGFVCISLIYLGLCVLLIIFKGKIIKNILFQSFLSETLTNDSDEQGNGEQE